MAGEECVVVDTNVLAVAEGLHEGAAQQCVDRCVALVDQLAAGAPLAVDAGDLILLEYVTRLTTSKRDGPAARLVSLLWRTRFGTAALHKVQLNEIDGGGFAEVPKQLRDFDSDDLKFIAVAAAEPCAPQIYAGLDEEWWERKRDFVNAGLDLQFLCSTELRDHEA